MANWNLIDSTVYTRVKNYIKTKDKSLKDSNFTSEDASVSLARFPLVKIKVVSMAERGADLSGDSINAVDVTFQIDVLTNESQSKADTLMQYAMEGMKKLRFQVNSMPIASKEDDIYRSVMRCRRIVGSGDTL